MSRGAAAAAASLLRLPSLLPLAHGRTRAFASVVPALSIVAQQAASPAASQAVSSEARGIQIGQSHAMHKTFTQAEVDQFLSMIGDSNPLHSDDSAATAAGFSGRIIPGILMTSMFPAIIGSTFPGAVYASQNVSYRSPALVGQPVVAQVTVSKRSRSWIMFHTCCTASDGSLLVEGEAMAKIKVDRPAGMPAAAVKS